MDYIVLRNDNIKAGCVTYMYNGSHAFQHEQAYCLLGSMLNDFYGIDIRKLHIRKTSYGKPYFEDCDISFNISHCKGMAVCAVSRGYKLGIDAEYVRDYRKSTAARIMNEAEYGLLRDLGGSKEFFFNIWTAKESLVKMSGRGITRELNETNTLNNPHIVGRYEHEYDGRLYIITVAADKSGGE